MTSETLEQPGDRTPDEPARQEPARQEPEVDAPEARGPSTELRARLALARIGEPGDVLLGSCVDSHGPVDVLDRLRAGHPPVGCPPGKAQRYLSRIGETDLDAMVEADLELADVIDARLVVPGTRGWPTQLDDLGPARPVVLWARGAADLRTNALCSVSVVGARAASAYGTRTARELGAGLAERSWTVVSGGAYGVDAAAHVGAMSAGGVTFAILASGIDEIYPRGSESLLARVLDAGLVVTELPPGSRPWRSRFLERNRLIAALSRGTVVVEAAVRSGAMSTAWRALELNRPLMGVPGPVTSAMSTGVHARIRAGEAVLVTSVDEVLEMVTPVGTVRAPAGSNGTRTIDGLSAEVYAVQEALSARSARSVRELAREAGVTLQVGTAALGELGVKGLAVREAGGWRAVPPAD